MGVRFYDKENMPNGNNNSVITCINCNCNAFNQNTLPSSTTTTTRTTTTTTTSKTTSTERIATEKTNSSSSGNKRNTPKAEIFREIVGNSKEVKINDNFYNLRIVGNNNCVRIAVNVGDISIVGNNTRLKIKINHGHINYTGNDGRISLGKDSSEQLVDYSGCNGVLRVQSSNKSSLNNCADDKMGNNCFKKQKEKYVTSCDSTTDIFNHKKSMPNITAGKLHNDNTCSGRPSQLYDNVVNNFGNIVITNSSNISISPYSYTY